MQQVLWIPRPHAARRGATLVLSSHPLKGNQLECFLGVPSHSPIAPASKAGHCNPDPKLHTPRWASSRPTCAGKSPSSAATSARPLRFCPQFPGRSFAEFLDLKLVGMTIFSGKQKFGLFLATTQEMSMAPFLGVPAWQNSSSLRSA